MKPILLLSLFIIVISNLYGQAYYRITNLATDQVLDAYQNGDFEGQVGTHFPNGNLNQQWTFTPSSNGGYFNIQSRSESDVLDLYQNIPNTVGLFELNDHQNQQWKLVPLIGGESIYTIQITTGGRIEYLASNITAETHGGFLVDADRVNGWDEGLTARYQWRIELVDIGLPDTSTEPISELIDTNSIYGIRSALVSGWALEPFNAETAPETNIQAGTYWATQSQLWTFKQNEANTVTIENLNSALPIGFNTIGVSSVKSLNRSYRLGTSTAWLYINHPDGTYSFISSENGLALTLKEINQNGYPDIVTDNYTGSVRQRWWLEKFDQVFMFTGNYEIATAQKKLFATRDQNGNYGVVSAEAFIALFDAADIWMINPKVDNMFKIKSRKYGKVLSKAADIEETLISLTLDEMEYRNDQLWVYSSPFEDKKVFEFVSVDGFSIAHNEVSEDEGTYGIIGAREGYNRFWTIRQLPKFVSTINIVNQASDETIAINITDPENPILEMQEINDDPSQGFIFISVNGSVYQLLNESSRFSLGAELSNAIGPQQYIGTASQHWAVVHLDIGTFRIVNLGSDYVLTLNPNGTLVQSTWQDLPSQKWRLEPVFESLQE